MSKQGVKKEELVSDVEEVVVEKNPMDKLRATLLINKKVRVRKMTRNWSGANAFTESTQVLYVPMEATGSLVCPLTAEEQRFFEEEIGLEKGALKKNSDYWKTNGVTIKGEEKVLDLTKPEHALEYKILLVCKKLVAKSLDEFARTATAQYAIIEEESEARKVNQSRKVKKEAYAKFVTMTFADHLNYLIATGRRPANTNAEIVEKAVGDDVENNPKFFLDTVNHPKYAGFILLNRGIQTGVLRKQGPAYYYNNDLLGVDIEAAVDFLFNKDNNDILQLVKVGIDKNIDRVLTR